LAMMTNHFSEAALSNPTQTLPGPLMQGNKKPFRHLHAVWQNFQEGEERRATGAPQAGPPCRRPSRPARHPRAPRLQRGPAASTSRGSQGWSNLNCSGEVDDVFQAGVVPLAPTLPDGAGQEVVHGRDCLAHAVNALVWGGSQVTLVLQTGRPGAPGLRSPGGWIVALEEAESTPGRPLQSRRRARLRPHQVTCSVSATGPVEPLARHGPWGAPCGAEREPPNVLRRGHSGPQVASRSRRLVLAVTPWTVAAPRTHPGHQPRRRPLR
jgi:hypothetical protein